MLMLVPLVARAGIQSATCLPGTAESRTWPVAVIYLHGLFESGADGGTEFRRLERANRRKLARLASEKHIRIAVPLGPTRGKYHRWNKVPLSKIEKMAKAACHGDAPIKGRDLIGFSNGAINNQKLSCAQTAAYSHIYSIGAAPYSTSGGTKACGRSPPRFQAYTPHDFAAGLARFSNHIGEHARNPVVAEAPDSATQQ